MALKSKRNIWHKIIFSWITIIILILLSILLVKNIIDIYSKNTNANLRAQDAQKDLIRIEERKYILNKNLLRIKTTRGIEEELRQRFDVAREGEHLLVIIDRDMEVEIEPSTQSWISNLWHKFKNRL